MNGNEEISASSRSASSAPSRTNDQRRAPGVSSTLAADGRGEIVHSTNEEERPTRALAVDSLHVLPNQAEECDQRGLNREEHQRNGIADQGASSRRTLASGHATAASSSTSVSPVATRNTQAKDIAEGVDEEVHEQPDEGGHRVRRCPPVSGRGRCWTSTSVTRAGRLGPPAV